LSNDTGSLPDGSTLRAVLEKLAQFATEGTPPDEALMEFAALSDLQTGTDASPRLDLVWEVENYTHAVHYDALLRPAVPVPGAGTVSLSYCPDRGLPWPLRHAHHARESDVASVNGHLIQVQSVMARLDFVWGRSDLMRSLVDEALITQEAEARGISASDADVQAEVDAFRQARGLFTAEATHAHLAERGWDEERLVMELAEVVGGRLLQRDVVPDAAVRAELEKPGASAAFDTARVARFSLQTSRAEEAQALAEQHAQIPPLRAPREQPLVVEEHVDQLPQHVVQRLDELLRDKI